MLKQARAIALTTVEAGVVVNEVYLLLLQSALCHQIWLIPP
jgi:hypothetical protein